MHIGRRYIGRTREYLDVCDQCGVTFHRGDLVLGVDGLLVCPDDRDGMTALEIDMQRAIDASEVTVVEGKKREGPG